MALKVPDLHISSLNHRLIDCFKKYEELKYLGFVEAVGSLVTVCIVRVCGKILVAVAQLYHLILLLFDHMLDVCVCTVCKLAPIVLKGWLDKMVEVAKKASDFVVDVSAEVHRVGMVDTTKAYYGKLVPLAEEWIHLSWKQFLKLPFSLTVVHIAIPPALFVGEKLDVCVRTVRMRCKHVLHVLKGWVDVGKKVPDLVIEVSAAIHGVGVVDTTKVYCGKLEPLAEEWIHLAWKQFLKLPFSPTITHIATPPALFMGEKVNKFLSSLKEHNFPLANYVPLLPLKHIETIIKKEAKEHNLPLADLVPLLPKQEAKEHNLPLIETLIKEGKGHNLPLADYMPLLPLKLEAKEDNLPVIKTIMKEATKEHNLPLADFVPLLPLKQETKEHDLPLTKTIIEEAAKEHLPLLPLKQETEEAAKEHNLPFADFLPLLSLKQQSKEHNSPPIIKEEAKEHNLPLADFIMPILPLKQEAKEAAKEHNLPLADSVPLLPLKQEAKEHNLPLIKTIIEEAAQENSPLLSLEQEAKEHNLPVIETIIKEEAKEHNLPLADSVPLLQEAKEHNLPLIKTMVKEAAKEHLPLLPLKQEAKEHNLPLIQTIIKEAAEVKQEAKESILPLADFVPLPPLNQEAKEDNLPQLNETIIKEEAKELNLPLADSMPLFPLKQEAEEDNLPLIKPIIKEEAKELLPLLPLKQEAKEHNFSLIKTIIKDVAEVRQEVKEAAKESILPLAETIFKNEEKEHNLPLADPLFPVKHIESIIKNKGKFTLF